MRWRLGLLSVFLSVNGVAGTQVILVGGGFQQDASQGQIEQNVLWLENLLEPRVPQLDSFFGSGEDHSLDVVYWDEARRQNIERNPIADLFGVPQSDWLQYKHHDVRASRGSTEVTHLKTELTSILAQPRGESLFFIYNGHGGYGGYNKPTRNHLKLWNNTRLSVDELRVLFNAVPDTTSTRFLVAQCYSGGFYHLLNESLLDFEKTPHQRCGFMAEAPDRESEGCELGINKDEFRDYSTYFFSALTQAPRHDREFVVNPDFDKSGGVSYREAHWYALLAAESSDLSRSTSEMYLEYWQPWYMRWYVGATAHNEYDQLAHRVAEMHGISTEKSLIQQRQKKATLLSKVESDYQHALGEIGRLRLSMQRRVELRYPFLKHPYSRDYILDIARKQQQVMQLITGLLDYPELVSLLESLEPQGKNILQLKRELTQIEKVARLMRLARLQTAFQRFASGKSKAQYQRLLDCENATL